MANYVPPGMEEDVETLAIDFDGVLHDDFEGWGDGTCYGAPKAGTLAALEQLSRRFKLVVFSGKARADRPLVQDKTGVELIWDWLRRYDVAHLIADVTAEKPRAVFYIDDKGIYFQSWEQTLAEIEQRVP